MNPTRRNFLKMSAASAVGFNLVVSQKVLAKPQAWPSTGTMEINPKISNKRVVSCCDPKMIKSSVFPTSFTLANAAVDTKLVAANIDAMAMQLSQQTTPELAWQTIFQKPADKTWNQVKAAIKVNLVNKNNHTRLAIVDKICRVLHGLGILPENIIAYDGCSTSDNVNGAQDKLWAPNFSTTDFINKIPGVMSHLDEALGGTIGTALVPTLGNHTCISDIAKGTIDILVNCAVNKGHDKYTGGTTLCMKNHFGTFNPIEGHSQGPFACIIGFNKSEAILGKNIPRQQLCIVDALYSDSNNNPNGVLTHATSTIVMGTFAPIVDYLTTIKIRKAIMIDKNKGKDNHDWVLVDRFITDFNYKPTDTFDWVEVAPTPIIIYKSKKQYDLTKFTIVVSQGLIRAEVIQFDIPAKGTIRSVRIVDVKGQLVKELATDQLTNTNSIVWDGKNRSNKMVGAGKYCVRIIGDTFEKARTIFFKF